MALNGWATLRHRDFAFLCSARFTVTLALLIAQVAMGWWLYDLTNDAFALGYLGLAGFVPALIMVPATGYAADNFDRRFLILISSLLLAGTGALLLYLIWFGGGLVWPIYVIVVMISIARSFANTAIQALTPNLVPQEQLSTAVAFSSSALQAAIIAGPAIGGLLYVVSSIAPFIAALVLWIVAAIAAWAIKHRGRAESGDKTISLRTLTAGFGFAWSRPVVFGAITLDALVVILGNVVILLPIFAKDILNVGPWGLGLLRSAPALGAFLMAVWLTRSDYVQRQAGTKLFGTVVIFGAATAVFGLSENFLLSLIALIIVGGADMISVVIRHTLVQSETPDTVRGRVTAVNSLFSSSSGELGQFRSGVVAGFFGPVVAVVAGGLGAVAVALLWPILFKDLRRRDHLVEPEPAKD